MFDSQSNHKPKRDAATRPIVGKDKIKWVFISILRSKAVAKSALSQLTDESFVEGENWLRALWQVVRQHLEDFDELPTKTEVFAQLLQLLEHSPQSLADGDRNQLNNLVNVAYEVDPKEINPIVVRTWLMHFLEDRLKHRMKQELAAADTPSSLVEVLGEYTNRAGKLTTIGADEIKQPFPEGWENEKSIEVQSTNIPWIDYFMEGGFAVGETYGLLGPYGGGKTTVGVMISVEQAVQAYHEKRRLIKQNPGVAEREFPHQYAYHFSYEAQMKELRERAISYLSQVRRDRVRDALKSPHKFKALNGEGQYSDYERQLFRSKFETGQPVRCEQRRVRYAIRVLNDHWRPLYMKDGGGTAGRGSGYIPEMASIISANLEVLEARGFKPRVRVALCDYALACAEFHIESGGRSRDEMRHLINRFPLHMNHHIAAPFNCHVWSLHQLNTDANSLAPGTVAKGTDSAEGRAFNENADFTMTLGRPTEGNDAGLQAVACTKHRRAKARSPIVVRMDAQLAVVKDVRNQWVVNESRKRILSVEEAAALGAAPPSTQSSMPGGSVAGMSRGMQ